MHGLMKLQEKIDSQSIKKVSWYDKENAGEPVPIPVLGPDIMDPKDFAQIRKQAKLRAPSRLHWEPHSK